MNNRTTHLLRRYGGTLAEMPCSEARLRQTPHGGAKNNVVQQLADSYNLGICEAQTHCNAISDSGTWISEEALLVELWQLVETRKAGVLPTKKLLTFATP